MSVQSNIHALHKSQPHKSWLQRLRLSIKRNSCSMAMYVPWVLPNWIRQWGIVTYLMALLVSTLMFIVYSLPWYYMLSGILSVLVFFGYGRNISHRLSLKQTPSTMQFERKIFGVAFLLRMAYMLLIYWIFMENYGHPFGFENMDARTYHNIGKYIADMLYSGNYHFSEEIDKRYHLHDISDMGYGIYVGFVYYLIGKSIIGLRILKCLWSALTVVLVYRLTFRHFSPQVARIAAIFCALWPNFWYYCGCHLKEVEMTFLAVLFVEQADKMLRSKQFTLLKLLPLALIIGALFTIRTVVALVAILALLFAILISSTHVVSWGKRIIVGLLAILLIGITMGERIEQNTRELVETVEGGSQQKSMNYQATVKGGNSFAKYAGAIVFAPMIFTMPFSAMVMVEGHDMQSLLNGGSYAKNIISFFVIVSMFAMLLAWNWRDHILPLAFLLGYLFVLAMSAYATSVRFHQPAVPLEMMFAAYGVSIVMTNKKYQKWFKIWCVIMSVSAIAWSWAKLAGRGLI